MWYLVLAITVLLCIMGPQLWVRYVLSRYSKEIPDLPGTGGELALHLLNRFELNKVSVEPSQPGSDHYDPQQNVVRLSPNIISGKSLTAVAVATHEVGHAIQFNRNEPVSQLRKRYLGRALAVQRIGSTLLIMLPVLAVMHRIPHIAALNGLIGVTMMLASVAMYAAILPEEWDASFNKALPILIEGDYVTEQQLPAIRRILKACALTYVAAALADIFRLWRWLALIR